MKGHGEDMQGECVPRTELPGWQGQPTNACMDERSYKARTRQGLLLA